MTMTIRRRRKVFLTFLFISGFGMMWLAYDPCYCWVVPPVWKLWMNDRQEMHLRPAHPGCQVLNLPPQPWPEDPSGERERAGEVFHDEYRQIPGATDEVLLGLRVEPGLGTSVVIPHYGRIKYSLKVTALNGRTDAPISSIHTVSDEVWNASSRLPSVYSGDADAAALDFTVYPENNNDDKPLHYRGKSFTKSNPFYWIRPSVLSASKSRIAVFSEGPGGITGRYARYWSDMFNKPWKNYSVDIYDVSSGERLGLIRFWACSGDLNATAWFGDHLLMIGLGSSQSLVCGFK